MTRAYFRQIKRPGIGRFVKSALFEKNVFITINENYQK